jgi:riboflavin kinase/FMN adenylyltransferase
VSSSEAPISSSLIRTLLAEGKVAETTRLLGRRYAVSGPVIHGDGRGRTIGIPTANIDVWPEQILPANGIYACWALIDGKPYRAAANIGFRPTFPDRPPAPRVEAHLLDFAQDLYGKKLRLEFVHYLRPEEKYATIQALVDQIRLDINQTVEVLERDR